MSSVDDDAFAGAIVGAAERIAAAIGRGGRLLVVGDGRAAADVDHVVVEYKHPVTVGKRALPAFRGRRAAAHGGSPADVVLSIAHADSRPDPEADVVIAAPGDVPSTQAWTIPLPASPGAAKVSAVLAYHIVWELTHFFLEHGERRPRSSADPAAASLYPMLYPDSPTSSSRSTEVTEAALASTRAKITESRQVTARAISDNDRLLGRASEIVRSARTVFTLGNGGSSTDAADAAFLFGRRGCSLGEDVATITALANDVSFDVVFARQLTTLARTGDCMIGFSTSGNSRNVIAAATAAAAAGVGTIGLAGYAGGEMAACAAVEVLLVVASDSVHRIQEAQSALVAELVERSG